MRIEGERALIVRLASMRFGGGTTGRLSLLLTRTEDSAILSEAASLVHRCETGAELLKRIGALKAR